MNAKHALATASSSRLRTLACNKQANAYQPLETPVVVAGKMQKLRAGAMGAERLLGPAEEVAGAEELPVEAVAAVS